MSDPCEKERQALDEKQTLALEKGAERRAKNDAFWRVAWDAVSSFAEALAQEFADPVSNEKLILDFEEMIDSDDDADHADDEFDAAAEEAHDALEDYCNCKHEHSSHQGSGH